MLKCFVIHDTDTTGWFPPIPTACHCSNIFGTHLLLESLHKFSFPRRARREYGDTTTDLGIDKPTGIPTRSASTKANTWEIDVCRGILENKSTHLSEIL